MQQIFRGAFWFGLYLFLVLFPLLIGSIFRPMSRPGSFLLNFSAGLAYLGYAIMVMELGLIARAKRAAMAFGLDALQQFHKEIAFAALLMVLAHPVLLVIVGYPWRIILPVQSVPWSVYLGTLAFCAVLLLIALSIFRKRLKIPYEVWQFTHGVLYIAVIVMAAFHIVAVGRFAQSLPMRLLWCLYILLLIGFLLYYRLVKPMMLWNKPWRVVENRVELGNARTIRLAPIGHKGFGFEAGQFAWLNTGSSPFSFEQHPISFSSNGDVAAETGEIAFTVKALGDWSSGVVPTIEPGRKMWIDGPYGVFTLDREQGPGYVFLAGGVGITPLRSITDTMAERGDVRPVILFYGAATLEDITYRDELLDLQSKMNLKVVYVLERPHKGWEGETGRISAGMLRKYLPPKQFKRWQYFICGPTPMMDAMERILPELNVPFENIHTERFDMV